MGKIYRFDIDRVRIDRYAAQYAAKQQLEAGHGKENTSVIILSETLALYAHTEKILHDFIKRYNEYPGVETLSTDHIRRATVQDFTGIRFYADYENKTLKNKDVAHAPRTGKAVLQYTNKNTIAIEKDTGHFSANGYCYDGISPIWSSENSAVTSTAIHVDYLRDNCKAISREQAMRLHPNMFLSGFFDNN